MSPTEAPLRVMHVAGEDSRFAHTGGLGEVVAGLSEAQAACGMDVYVLLPGYAPALERLENRRLDEACSEIEVAFDWGPARFQVWAAEVGGVKVRMFTNNALFGRPALYGAGGHGYFDNPVRFSAFARVVQAWIGRHPTPPDVVHGHDWHAGLAIALLHSRRTGKRAGPALVQTVHNLAYQGCFPREAFGLTGLPSRYRHWTGALHNGEVNMLKAGLQAADRLTTVSPTYAKELLGDAGWTLAGLFAHRQAQMTGIVNGITPAAPAAGEPSSRAARRKALCREFGVTTPKGPLYAMVSRLTGQKGVDLVAQAAPKAVEAGASVVILGSGEPLYAEQLRALAAEYPERVGFSEAFDVNQALRMFRAADAFLMPSRFEPCGMSQLHAMHHGCVPLVRRTGGLGDTVVDASDGGWGVLFDDDSSEALAQAMQRTAALYGEPELWAQLVERGKAVPTGWTAAAGQYDEVYRGVIP